MPMIPIDEKEYDYDSLPANAKEQLQSLQFVDKELQRTQAQAAVFQFARRADVRSLQQALPQLNRPGN